MPIYEYQGKQYNIDTTDQFIALKTIEDYLGVSKASKPIISQEPTSALAAGAKSAVESAIPTATGFAAAGQGAGGRRAQEFP